ncbi:aminopeptidase [Mycoplasmopsis pullorum]|uniref:M20/M25/M40 family metallo-hydrolase n=1 Tax=Mycoplasmopsis pullorum TaxID=48003 RepID=UPI001119718A|nr:M20/M25/M40 family metallo-hydrolase [Mycoplasmopsis pullorum]TNK83633.1 aminopeptidase [Mycoplasmopsis pullorum]TNK92225.1 aminopeptidase [Mycoplasmopsis pullorum]
MSDYKKIADRLDQYMQIEAISRYEEPVVEALKQNIVSDNFEYSRDHMGSLIIHKPSKNPNAPKVMIAAHMDEVGYLVRMVKENGNILVSTVGGVWPSVVIGTKAKVVTNRGNKEYYGVFGHTSIHIMERDKFSKAITADELFVDLGFNSAKEVEEAGIEIGDRIYLSGETLRLPNNIIGGKAMDNRAGVTALDFIANNVKDLDLDVDLYLVGTVQEEVGTRGAKTSVSLINPDVAFAVDTGASHDTTGCKAGTPVLGKGAAVLVKDGGTLIDPKLFEYVMKVAREKNILAYKYIAEGGGTDAAELQYAQGGAATITISIPQRYLHSPIGYASLVDIDATINLVTEFLKSFNAEEYNQMRYK